MLLAAIALTLSIVLGAPGHDVFSAQPASPRSQLPATQPGLSRSEGVFLVTAADDGSRLVYFIAQNSRHSTLTSDLQLEQQLNSLWPVWLASREDVLAFPEAAPVGAARVGLLSPGPATAEALPTLAEAPASAAPAGDEAGVYVLQRGDNLTRLSARYGTTVEALLAANGLADADRIYFGQPLVIPGTAAPAPDELLAQPTPIQPAPAAPAPDAAPAAIADLPATADATTYTVIAGDSAIHIARRFGVEVDALLAANNVTNPNRVYVGQVLDIPVDEAIPAGQG